MDLTMIQIAILTVGIAASTLYEIARAVQTTITAWRVVCRHQIPPTTPNPIPAHDRRAQIFAAGVVLGAVLVALTATRDRP
jgi:hypothetical protein